MNNRFIPKYPKDDKCNDYIYRGGMGGSGGFWIELIDVGVSLYVHGDNAHVQVELVPIDPFGRGAESEITLDSCFATRADAEKSLEEFYKEEI